MNSKKAHLFICVNDRGTNGKDSCARRGSQALRDEVKSLCKHLPKDLVRVNNAGCLGPCERGITAVLYPKGEWLLDLKPGDSAKLVEAVEKAVRD